jgi:hypothetical protein
MLNLLPTTEMRRKVRPLFMKDESTPLYPQKYVYDVMGTVCTLLIMNYIGLSFVVRASNVPSGWIVVRSFTFFSFSAQVLEWPPVYQTWKSTYFAGHVLLFTAWFVVTYVIPARRRAAPKKAD